MSLSATGAVITAVLPVVGQRNLNMYLFCLYGWNDAKRCKDTESIGKTNQIIHSSFSKEKSVVNLTGKLLLLFIFQGWNLKIVLKKFPNEMINKTTKYLILMVVAKTTYFLSKSHDLPQKVIGEVLQININISMCSFHLIQWEFLLID